MPKSGPRTLAPKQARSRESLKRLLHATAGLLEEVGLERTTIPLIAARAGLSPGAVYRRFRDKDALLRTLLIETLQGTLRHTEATLTPDFTREHSLAQLARKILTGTVQSYRKHAGLMRGLTHFSRSHPSASFRRQADELEIENFRRIAECLLSKRREIGHPRPQRAVSFGLMFVALALQEMIVLDVLSDAWSSVMPKNDDELIDELTRALLNYFGVSERS